MGRVYTVPYQGTLTNAGGDADLFEFQPAAEKPIRLIGLILGQTSEIGDAMEEALRVSIIRLPLTLTGGNGTAVTPVAVDDSDGAASFAAEANGATVATTSGTAVVVEEFGWNVRGSPLERWWPDDNVRLRYRRSAGTAQGLVVRCQSTVADDVTIQITAYIEEIG